MNSLDTKQMAAIIEGMAKKIEAEKEYLTELDNEIGDGDHGINLARGFEAVEKKLPSWQAATSAPCSKASACSSCRQLAAHRARSTGRPL